MSLNPLFHRSVIADIKCPHCGKSQAGKPMKSWSYGKVSVQRFHCKCSKLFNFYKTAKSSWTIPKPK